MLGSTMKTLANPRAGDIFYIPAIDGSSRGGFVLARYIDAIGKAGYLIEVFSKFYLVPPGKLSDVDTSQRLFRPIMCSMSFRNLPNWKILFHDSSYTKSQSSFDEIKISFDDEIWAGGKSSKATDRELAKHEPSICWRMDHLIFRVNSHLKGEFTADERYDYYRTPEKQDDPAAIAKVLELTKEMAKKFESWDTVSVIK